MSRPKPRQIISTGFSAIFFDHFGLRASTLGHGKELVRSGNVQQVEELRKAGFPPEIKARVIPQTNINNPMYIVEIFIDSKRKILRANCSCKGGCGGACKHVAAVIHYVNTERSEAKTDKVQQHSKPSDHGLEKYRKGKPSEEINQIPASVRLSLMPLINFESINESFFIV